jgi:hypothetical protein
MDVKSSNVFSSGSVISSWILGWTWAQSRSGIITESNKAANGAGRHEVREGIVFISILLILNPRSPKSIDGFVDKAPAGRSVGPRR